MAMNQFGAGFNIWAKDFASGVFGRVGKNFSGMTNKAERDAKSMQSSLQRIGKGMGIIAAGFGIVRPIQIAIGESTKLNTALAEVGTLTDEATFPVERMKGLVKDLAAQYGEKATAQAKALYQTISAGFGDAADASRMLDVANRLAIGGVAEVSTAVDGLTNVLNTYSSANLDALDVSDAFFVAVKAGKTTVGELSQQIGRVAPGAEAMGIKMEELLAAMAAITTKGIDTRQTVSGLAASLANIIRPTADAEAEAKKLGIQFSAAALRSKGLKGFLDSITKSAKFNDDSISQLFGSIEAFKVMTALASDESSKFNEVLGMMEKRAGATNTAVAKMEDTFAHQAKQLGAIVNNIQTTVGDAGEALLAPVLKLINKAAGAVSSFLDSLPPEARQALVGVVGGMGGFIGMTGALIVLSGVMNMLGLSVTGVVFSLGKLLLVGGPLIVLLAGLGVASYSAFRAFDKNTSGISTSWQDMVRQISLGWKGMMNIITGEKFDDELIDQLGRAENVGVLRFLRGFGGFVERVSTFWDGLTKGFEAGVDRLADSSAMKKLKTTIDSVVGIFTGEAAQNSTETLEEWEKKGMAAGDRLAALGEIALTAIGKVVDIGGALVAWIGDVKAEDIAVWVEDATTAFEGLWAALKEVGTVLMWIGKIIKPIVNLIQFLGASVAETSAAMVSGEFAELTETRKQFNELAKSLGAESDLLATGQIGVLAGAGMSREQAFGFKTTAQGSVRPEAGGGRAAPGGVVWQKPPTNVEELRKAKANAIEWITTSREEWRRKNPDRYSYQEASREEQRQAAQEIKRLAAAIEKLAKQPVILNVDSDKLGEAVRGSNEAEKGRDLDDPGAGGF